ncbi:MAG: excinuclease ABC subunit UvrC [Deltaproteobacteria bacterium]|nr:excinuclease ABC subunit UvrC [Deltaproteobacteria bacterium]
MDIEARLKSLPKTPGVYLMKGASGKILYIGKAKDLKSRVRSYFRGSADDGRYASRFLASKTEDIDCIITTTEKEALILEDTLLKKHKPPYNIRLKDDKTYVSIRLTVEEPFPRIEITRRTADDKSRYFGPYASASQARETLKFLRRIFPLCVCSLHEFRNRTRPCLDYQLGLCASPATGLISEGKYREIVDGAIMFLEGRNLELVRELKKNMLAASEAKRYEDAAVIRDRIGAIEASLEEQKVVSEGCEDEDYFALEREDGALSIAVLNVRQGRLISKRGFNFKDTGVEDSEIMASFLSQFYRRSENNIPAFVFLSVDADGPDVMEEWLSELGGKRVEIRRPERGGKKRLMDMALLNAKEALIKAALTAENAALIEIGKKLNTSRTPVTIEAFDISNIGGESAVGAMVRFKNGVPEKKHYRLYKIKGVDGPDDYAMMREVMERRYLNTNDVPVPDLILVDGGKGQLAVALKVASELKMEGAAIASLAKDREGALPPRPGKKVSKGERVFIAGVKDPVVLKEGSKGDLLLRRVRDEVHRFAVSYHRKLRGKKSVRSVLDDIPGIGPAKKKLIFEKFVDLDGLRAASIDDIAALSGITPETARLIKEATSKKES